MRSGISNMWLCATPLPWVTCRFACAMRQNRFIMGRPISKLPLIITAQLPESCKVNRQYGSGIGNMWLFVTHLPWVTCRGACAMRQKRFMMGRLISKLPLIITAAPWKLQCAQAIWGLRFQIRGYLWPPTLCHVSTHAYCAKYAL